MGKFNYDPYWSDYNPDKNFVNVLGVPGHVLQAREVTEIGEIAVDHIGRLGDSVWGQGQIVDGCEIDLRKVENRDQTTGEVLEEYVVATITAGRVWLDGLVRLTPETVIDKTDDGTIRIPTTGELWIGCRIKGSVVTADDDPDLLDPALGSGNEGSEGAARYKEVFEWGIIDEVEDAQGNVFAGTGVFHIKDGGLFTIKVEDKEKAELQATLARRTFDENGSYRVHGLIVEKKLDAQGNFSYVDEVDSEGNATGNKVYPVLVGAGKAYVRGWEIERFARETVNVPVVDTSATRSQSIRPWNDSTPTTTPEVSARTYEFIDTPVTSVRVITGEVFLQKAAFTGDASDIQNLVDNLQFQSNEDRDYWKSKLNVKAVNAVYASDSSTALVYGEDWEHDSSNSNCIKWLKPMQSGATYYVDVVFLVSYSWKRGNAQGDFILLNATSEDAVEDLTSTDVTRFRFTEDLGRFYPTAVTSERGVRSASIQASYDYRCHRIDMVLLSRDNNIIVRQGVANTEGFADYPTNQDVDCILLAYVKQGEVVSIENIQNYRLTQDEMNRVRDRVDILEVNLAMTDLDRAGEENDPATDLNGIYSDGFLNYQKFDLTSDNYEQNYTAIDPSSENPTHIKMICSVDLDENVLTLPLEESATEYGIHTDPRVNSTASTGYKDWGRVMTALYTEQIAMVQPYATNSININPYAAVDPLCLVSLNPSVDIWTETSYQVVNNTVTHTTDVTKKKTLRTTNRRQAGKKTSSTTTSTSKTSQKIEVEDVAIEYMRENVIRVFGKAFPISYKQVGGLEFLCDKIRCYFDGEPVEFLEDTSTESHRNARFDGKSWAQAVSEGLIDADKVNSYLCTDGNGECWGDFVVPPGHQCGSVEVVLKYEGDGTELLNKVGATQAEGKAIYRAEGRFISTTETNTTVVEVVNTNVVTTYVFVDPKDPVAQSFMFDKTQLLTKVGLYFQQGYQSITPTERDQLRRTSPVVVQIVGMTDGYPNHTVYAEAIVSADKVKINATAPTISETKDPINYVVPADADETVFEFNQPVVIQADTEYALVVMCDTQAYRVWYAGLGEDRVDTASAQQSGRNKTVAAQPNTGVMFTSANHSTWTAHQEWDLTFKLYTAKFNRGPATIVFGQTAASELHRLMLLATYVDYAASGVRWQYQLTSGSQPDSWKDITPDNWVDGYSAGGTLFLRAIMSVTDTTRISMSPILAKDCVAWRFQKYYKSGEYVSRYSNFDTAYNTIRVQCEICLPMFGPSTKLSQLDEATGKKNVFCAVHLARESDKLPFNVSGIPSDSSGWTWDDFNNDKGEDDSSDAKEKLLSRRRIGTIFDTVREWTRFSNAPDTSSDPNHELATRDDWLEGFCASAEYLGYNWWRFVWYRALAKRTNASGSSPSFESVPSRGVRAGIRMFCGLNEPLPRVRNLIVTTSNEEVGGTYSS